MMAAAGRMKDALGVVVRHCREAGIPVESLADPNGTCLVGPELGGLFTTLGQLEAKRTTLNPDMAGLMVHLLREAGVGRGDTVAVGASGSFPALMVATVVAVEALRAHPQVVLSLGASSFGATRPDFHLLHLYLLLREEGVLFAPPVGVSLGGSRDLGLEFEAEVRDRLLRDVAESGLPLLSEPDLISMVAGRMALFSPRVAAFVNVGGTDTNLGTSSRILALPPGLVSSTPLPPAEERGVLYDMVSRGVPVIHLLHVRGLTLRYGLPWDPIPLPAPGSAHLRDESRGKGPAFWILTAAYLGGLALVVSGGRGWEGDAGRPP
jgi:poly-gamma-glutamate system protein